MSEHPMICEAVCSAMAGIGAIRKANKNQQQGFLFRGIDDVMNALYPVLTKHRLFLTPEVLEHTREERQTRSGGNLIYSILKVKYTLYAADGSNVSAVVIGEGMDSADKSSNKAMAVAMKYAMFQLFCIPTEEMASDDPDRVTPPSSVPAAPVAVHKGTTVPATSAPEALNRKQAVADVISMLGLAGETDFACKVAALKAGGAVVDKPSKDMTDDEFRQTLNAVVANYGAAS